MAPNAGCGSGSVLGRYLWSLLNFMLRWVGISPWENPLMHHLGSTSGIKTTKRNSKRKKLSILIPFLPERRWLLSASNAELKLCMGPLGWRRRVWEELILSPPLKPEASCVGDIPGLPPPPPLPRALVSAILWVSKHRRQPRFVPVAFGLRRVQGTPTQPPGSAKPILLH